MTRGLPAPQFEIRDLWVKWMENGIVKQAWNMLQDVGSPEPRHTHSWPRIPEWNQRVGGFNFQIEATVLNKTSATLNLKFRTQSCPRGTYGLPPMPKPPCGDLVDSGAAVTVRPYGTAVMPVFQLRMWGKDIDQHCEIVDANDQTVYNCLVPYKDNATYQADDWYIPIDSVGAAGMPGGSFWQSLSGAQAKPGGVQTVPQTKVGLAGLFGAALKSMSQNRQAINEMDGYNGNHGDNMTQNLQIITDALRSRESQPPAEALRYASQMLQNNGVGGSSGYYAQGLNDAAANLRDKPEMSQADVANLVLSLLNSVPTQSDPSRSQASDNVLEQMMGLARQQPPSPPTKDMGATASQLLSAAIPAALAFMQAKQGGADTKSAAVQSLISSLVGGQVNPLQARTPRTAAGSLIAQSILQAMLG